MTEGTEKGTFLKEAETVQKDCFARTAQRSTHFRPFKSKATPILPLFVRDVLFLSAPIYFLKRPT